MPQDPTPGAYPAPRQPKKKRKPAVPFTTAIGSARITPGPNPTITERRPPAPPKRPNIAVRTRTILRRQRLLRRLGYKIPVDGVWGPRSQRSWGDYVRRKRLPLDKIGDRKEFVRGIDQREETWRTNSGNLPYEVVVMTSKSPRADAQAILTTHPNR